MRWSHQTRAGPFLRRLQSSYGGPQPGKSCWNPLRNQATNKPLWTFHAVAESIGNRFEDISTRRAQLPGEEVQPSRYRIRTKRPADQPLEPLEEGHARCDRHARSRSREPARSAREEVGAAWWSDIPQDHWPDQKAGYWADPKAAVEIEISMPESQRGCRKAYFIGSLKRRTVELSERKMTDAEREDFKGAKGVEVRNFIASQAFEVLPDYLKPDKSQAIGTRWILTWKLRDDGSRKANARAVLLGYQDEGYAHRATTSPVMTRQTRQMVLQLSAWKRWKLQKGDVTGAFLQSREYPDKLYCIPTPEICQALGIPEGSITKVRRACYGLVDAPLEWWRSVDSFLRNIGFERLWSKLLLLGAPTPGYPKRDSQWTC